ncbi:hypothetical protein [Flavobacterium cellulosilyticum]|uniref:DUF5362 domain-containing protein n=1 Tax=Flavobacterium cellulosilyticum TaxID=2541731 RepID=A0A4R5CBQ4_9FLAO|nr:hypothetical protein [Flavobacterium cellulosilyticum]TDD97388.1 hypothetical protein E0F76_08750 [Flavobacterium cellulosilyticum]
MENSLEPSEESLIDNFELQLNESAKGFLKETAKWAYFLSILGFIGVGLMVVLAVFAGTIFGVIGHMMPGMGMFGSGIGIVISIFYLLIAALYFFPVYYLYKFASNAKKAFLNIDSELLSTSFKYLKSHYKFIGIMMISIMCLYGLIIVFAVIAAIAR